MVVLALRLLSSAPASYDLAAFLPAEKCPLLLCVVLVQAAGFPFEHS